MHQDLSKQYFTLEEQRADRIAVSHKEELAQKYARLATEFDQINDVQNAEKNFVNQLVLDPTNEKKWGEFAYFCLKHDLQLKAEECLYR